MSDFVRISDTGEEETIVNLDQIESIIRNKKEKTVRFLFNGNWKGEIKNVDNEAWADFLRITNVR